MNTQYIDESLNQALIHLDNGDHLAAYALIYAAAGALTQSYTEGLLDRRTWNLLIQSLAYWAGACRARIG